MIRLRSCNAKPNFYPRSPCGERRVTVLGIQHRVGISIHALLAESDDNSMGRYEEPFNFYPRSPCGERPKRFSDTLEHLHFYPRSPCGERPCITTTIICIVSFLSTLSLRRATHSKMSNHPHNTNFYPRSPCGERQRAENHANSQQEFLSTLSLRRATF